MVGAYRTVLRRRDVLAALLPYLLARLPLSMGSLALLLLVRSQSGSYRMAGLACAAYGVSIAVTAPALGRMVDRHGQSTVLLYCGLLHPAAMAGLAFAAQAGRFPLVMLAAVVAGACLPPVSACMRVLWSRLLDGDARRVGFAIEGIVVEAAELSGPLLVSLALLLSRPDTAVLASGLMTGVGALLFRLSSASRDVQVAPGSGHWWGALGLGPVRRILLVILTSTMTIGAVEVAVAAFARHHGGQATTGVYVAAISAGGILAGLSFGSAGKLGRRSRMLLAATLFGTAATAAAAGWAHTTVAVLPVLFAFGGLVAVSVIIQLAWMAEAAPEDVRTEAFTWGGTANFIGLALGTVSAGWVVDNGGAANGFLLAGIPALLSVAVVALTRVDYAEADRAEALESVAEPVDTAAEAAPPVLPEPTVTWQTELELAEAAARWWEREATSLRERVADLQNALEAALLVAPSPSSQSESHARVQRMLERADAACLELRQRAEDDARRVRAAATTASLEILAAVQRDAHALLARARRDADAIAAEAAGRQVGASTALPTQPTGRPLLLALPGLVEAGSAGDDRADRDQDQATEAQ